MEKKPGESIEPTIAQCANALETNARLQLGHLNRIDSADTISRDAIRNDLRIAAQLRKLSAQYESAPNASNEPHLGGP